MTAFIGQRLRSTLPGIVATGAARRAALRRDRDPATSRRSSWRRCCWRRSGWRPLRRGGRRRRLHGLPSRSRALRRRRVPALARALRHHGVVRGALFLAFGIALSPLGGRGRVIATLILWAAVAWPIAGLMLRSLYGALSGRLVVRLRPAE